jgi:tRNA(adenine34) deaminase
MADHDRYMRLALEEGRRAGAEGNLAIGSVIVRDGQVIGAGRNTINTESDPTNHAETAAIRDACRALASKELPGATLYTTMEPCPMCLWAICLAGVEELVVGARHADVKPPRIGYGHYAVEALLEMTGRRLGIVTGVLTQECLALREAFEP